MIVRAIGGSYGLLTQRPYCLRPNLLFLYPCSLLALLILASS